MRNLSNVETIYTRQIQLKTITCHVMEGFEPEGIDAPIVTMPQQIAELARVVLKELDDDQEHFILFIINTSGKVMGYKVIASGGMNYAQVDLKLVFRSAILLGASRIAVCHNHPSGTVEPSREDIAITKQLVQCGKLLGIDVMDHIIVARTESYSMAENYTVDF